MRRHASNLPKIMLLLLLLPPPPLPMTSYKCVKSKSVHWITSKLASAVTTSVEPNHIRVTGGKERNQVIGPPAIPPPPSKKLFMFICCYDVVICNKYGRNITTARVLVEVSMSASIECKMVRHF